VILVIHTQTGGLGVQAFKVWKFIPLAPPLFLSNGQLLFILLFDTFEFMTCHSSNTACIVMEVAILIQSRPQSRAVKGSALVNLERMGFRMSNL
jgi:hypothetical protein